MSNQEAFYSQLYQYIEKIANQVSDLRGSDTIKTGTIIQVLPGHYVVQLNEGNEQSSVKAIALNTNDPFSLQDYVYLMQATGSIENTYFIIGKVEQIQEDFLNLTLTERFTSSNELSGDLLKLNTKIEDLTILSDIKANRVFQIKGTFTCNKLNEENYGLKISFNCGDQVIKTYNFDTNYFIGQPFEMTSQPQMRTILLDEVVLKSNFDNIIITKFGSDFTYSDITIASGSLLDVNGIVNVSLSFKNKKDYFSLSGTEVDNSVKVSAEVEYEGAPLVAPGIQYYWLLKDDSIDENSEYYFSYAGKGWKCLNTYDNVSGVGADGSSLTLQIWDSGENNIILSETGFPDFINTFKCIVKYQDIVVSSPETTIYNYNKESFFVELESNIQPPLLILETDQVILSAVVEDENEKTHMSDYTCAYQWQVENENGDWEVVTKKEVSEGVFEDTFAFNEYNAEHVLTKDWSKLTIVDQLLSDMEGDSSFYVLHGEGEEITKNFRCVVRVYRKDDLLNFVSEDFSESMQVVSKVAIAAQLVSTIYYKYYISDTPYTLFPKLENGEGDWEGDWSISIKRISEEEEEYFVSQNWTEDSNLAHWSSDDLQEFPSGKVNQDAYNYIIGKFIENPQNGSYLYITSQEVWVEERLEKINFLRKDNWTIPALAKGYSNNGNYLDDKAVDKLNTFTHLTEGGLNKGLLYDEDTGDLYINADFINTGALRVANNLGKEVLYADVDTGKVEVGGFTVDEYTLTSKNNNVGLNSNEAASSDAAIWVGQEGSEAYTKITHDGVLHAKGIIVEGNIEVKSSNTIATKKELEESSKQLSEDLDSAEKSWNKALEDQNKALLDELKVLDETTKKYINSIEEDLQNQIDGSISSWFYEGVPTLDNAPASTWKDEEKGAHLGDLYYDLKTGKCYRWAQEQNGGALEWEWVLVTDTDIALALENAAKAQATADGKITTFNGNNGTTFPSPPYQKGDLLVNMKRDSSSDAQTYICVINKKAGESPSWNDWTSIGNYATSSTLAAVEDDLQSQIDARMSIWYYNGVPTVSNDPAKNWTTVELQKQHDKDLYYDLDTGRAYRWIYSASGNKWEEVLDIRITQALADAATAQATADSKITSFYGERPTEGYQYGDVWMEGETEAGTGKMYTCIVKNITGQLQDWKPVGDFVTGAEVEETIKATQEDLEELIGDLDSKVTASTYFSTAELESTSGIKIPAIVMKAKDDEGNGVMYFSTEDLVINSQNLRLNHNGSKYYKNYLHINTTPLKLYNNSYMTINTTPIKLNYSNSKYSLQINTDNFKIDSDGDVTIIGKVTATSLEINPDAAGKAGLATSSDLSEVSSVASQAQGSANQAAADAANAAKDAGDAKNVADQAKGIADDAAKDANTAKSTADTAKSTATKVAQDVETLTSATLPATYLGVNTTNDWIYIKSKTENSASPGKIFFDADALIINSDNLKVNVNGDHKVTVKGALEATSLTISQEVAKEAGLGSQVSDNLLFDSAKEVVNQYSAQGPEFVQSAYNLSPVFKKYGLVPYTLSFDLQAPVTGSVQVYCQNGNGSEYSFSKAVVVESINTWKRYKVTFTPYKTDQSTYTSSLLVFYGEYNTGRVPRIRNIKLELGDTGLLVPPWSPAVEESAAPNENLAVSTALSISGKTDNDKFLGNKFSLSLRTKYSGVGVRINSDIFKKPGTFSNPIDAYDFEAEYVLSFKYREVNSDGTVRTGQPLVHHIGGRASWFTPTKIIYTNNGNQYHATPHADGSLSWSNPTLLPGNLNGELYIRAYFKTHAKENCSNVSDWNLYIQPGRPSDVYAQPVYCEIWDVKVEKGTIATGWQVAKKDTETFFNVDPSTGNITLKAANSLSLTGDKFEITSGKFQVSTTGKVTATDLHVSQGTIADWSITPELQVYGTVGFHDLVSGGNGSHTVTKWNSLYTGGITSSHLYALSTNGLQVEYVDDDADYQRQVISFTWPQLAKTLLKCVGIKSGQVVIPAGKKEWVFTPAFTTTRGSLYRVICTPCEKFSSADIMTSAYWEQQPNGDMTYYVGRKRNSGDDYSTIIEWIAIPMSVFGFHYDFAGEDNMKLLK